MKIGPHRNRVLFWGFLVSHSLFLVLLSFYLFSLNFMRGKEARVLKGSAAVFRTLLPEPDKPGLNEFGFINVSYDRQLIDRLDRDGFPAGNEVITDRGKLARLFKVLNQNPNYKYLICDIFFDGVSPDDSILNAELQQLPNAIYSYHQDENGDLQMPIFKNLNYGLADYASVGRDFLKFSLVSQGIPSLPVRVFEELDGGHFQEENFAWDWNGRPAFNNFVLDFRIRPYDIFRDTLNYPYVNLHDLDQLIKYGGSEQVHEFTKDRILVIGDFEITDKHPTMYGEMPGPLILTNIYLALKKGDNRILFGFPAFLFIIYFILSYILFTKSDFFGTFFQKRVAKNKLLLLYLSKGLSYLLILAVVSILCFIFFNTYINFLILCLYFNLAEVTRSWWLKRRGIEE